MENHHFQWVNPRTKRLFPPISNPSKNHRSVETAHGCHRMTSDATNDSRGLGQGPLPPPAKQSQGPEIGERAKLLGITFFFKVFFWDISWISAAYVFHFFWWLYDSGCSNGFGADIRCCADRQMVVWTMGCPVFNPNLRSNRFWRWTLQC